jgi:p-hydroxybenzoate 3-monooxygenase
MRSEGLPHDGFQLCFGGQRHRINMHELVGKKVVVYGQTEITRDLMECRAVSGGETIYEALDVRLDELQSSRSVVRFVKDGVAQEIHCDFVAGCDGFHGVSRKSLPATALQQFVTCIPASQ